MTPEEAVKRRQEKEAQVSASIGLLMAVIQKSFPDEDPKDKLEQMVYKWHKSHEWPKAMVIASQHLSKQELSGMLHKLNSTAVILDQGATISWRLEHHENIDIVHPYSNQVSLHDLNIEFIHLDDIR